MGRALILETTFLIDLEREHHRAAGAAVAFLEANDDARLPALRGGRRTGRGRFHVESRQMGIVPRAVLHPAGDRRRELEHGRACRYLKDNGRLIGGNDLWIAATGLAYGMPVVTRNVEHYRRVPGLEVESY